MAQAISIDDFSTPPLSHSDSNELCLRTLTCHLGMKETQSISLKPFSRESDPDRNYDLIRALVIHKTINNHPNKSKKAIKGLSVYTYVCVKKF